MPSHCTLFGHVKGGWPHLEKIIDPGELEAELSTVLAEWVPCKIIRCLPHRGYQLADQHLNFRGEGSSRGWPPAKRARRVPVGGLVRIPIEGGGSVLVDGGLPGSGPVKAGRVGDVVEDATSTLQAALVSVRDASRAVLEQLREAGPDEVGVEFGVELTAQAGAVIARAGGGCHFTVKLTWKSEIPDAGGPGSS